MRIAFDHQTFTLQTYGGISRYFARLAQEFLDMGEEVKIFAPFHRNAYLTSLPNEAVQGMRLKRYPPKLTHVFKLYNRLASLRAIEKWQPDILHETYYAKKDCVIKKRPTVITVYDMIHELYHKDFELRDRTSEIKKVAIAGADHIICISENTKKDLMHLHGISESKISVVLLGFDHFASRQNKSRYIDYMGRPFLLYVGSRGGYKNFAGMLKAIAASSSMKSDFDVVAFGGGGFNNIEQELISSLGFSLNQVKQISGDDALLGHYYASARAFIYPSLYEGFGIPPLEAMAHGCPVVCSNSSSMPEVIGLAGEYFNPTSIDEMKNSIERIAYDDSRIVELKLLGDKRLAHFSWAKCAEETRAVYQKLF